MMNIPERRLSIYSVDILKFVEEGISLRRMRFQIPRSPL